MSHCRCQKALRVAERKIPAPKEMASAGKKRGKSRRHNPVAENTNYQPEQDDVMDMTEGRDGAAPDAIGAASDVDWYSNVFCCVSGDVEVDDEELSAAEAQGDLDLDEDTEF